MAAIGQKYMVCAYLVCPNVLNSDDWLKQFAGPFTKSAEVLLDWALPPQPRI